MRPPEVSATMSEALQQQIASLNAAQRVGIVAAVALSSFAAYATTKHKSDLPDLPQQLRRQREPLLGCPHDEGFGHHPHSQSCLQCNDRHHASNALDRSSYMGGCWTSSSTPTSSSPSTRGVDPSLLRCPHNQKLFPNAPACSRCQERSYTGAVDRGRMTNWASSPGSPGSESSGSMSSFQSMPRPKLADLANLSQVPVLGDAGRMPSMGSMASRGGVGALAESGGAVAGPAGLGRTTLYFIFWYLCALCNDQ